MRALSTVRTKHAATDHVVMQGIAERWSPHSFADRPVDDATLLRILEAARWAPSNFNEQPWRFIVTRRRDAERYERLLACLTEKNQSWARTAPVLMLSIAKERYTYNDKPNRTVDHDVGLAVAQMVMQATHEGLYVRQMAGIDLEACRTAFEIPDGFHPIAAIALGHLGDPDALPEFRDSEAKPRTRRPLAQTVFGSRFGATAEFVDR